MSPRKMRRLAGNIMDYSTTSRNSRSKASRLITLDKKISPFDENDLENQEKDQTNGTVFNDLQQKQKQSTRLSRKKKYLEKSKNSYTSNESTLAPKDVKLKEKKDVAHNNTLVDIDNISYELIEESPIQFKNASMRFNKMKQFNTSADLDISSKEENIHNNSLNGTITPKCSPISVTLTPLRTTKTPKKSPLNLGSPKVPSEVAFRLSKTPRKLQLFSSSPTVRSSIDRSLLDKKNLNNNVQNTTLSNISVNDDNAKPNKLRKNRTSAEKLELMLRRSSKTPTIVLKLPSSKSELGKSKMKFENHKDGMSVRKLRRLKQNVSRKVSAFSNKNDNKNKSLSSEESQLELTLTNVNNLSDEYKKIILKKPIVLLERIPLLDSLSASLKSQSNQRLMESTLDVAKYVQKQLFKDLSSLKHSVLNINHKYPMKTEDSILSKSFKDKGNVELNNTNSLVSSTPVSSRNSNSTFFTSTSFTSDRVKQNGLMEDDDMQNTTYDVNETNDNKNNTMIIESGETAIADETYNIFEPKTPCLRERNRKNTTLEVDDDEKEIKKVSKVRFTTPELQIERLQSNNNIAIRKTPRVKYISLKRSSPLSNTSKDKSTPKLVFKSSMSTPNVNPIPSKNGIKKEKRLPSSSVQIKYNTEDKEKKDVKTQIVKKKIPNFVEIHKQIFAKMESIVDNKKRLMQQHEALKTPKVVRLDKNNIKKRKSIDSKNESYNRFGFKIKKTDATNIILRKKQTNVPIKKREENKAFLKGVRTNRRFELLMKLRKISN